MGSPSRPTIDGCVCNELMSTEPGKLIGTKFSFQMNHAAICGAMTAAFVLDALPVNAAFQNALPSDRVAEFPKLWSGVRFPIMDDSISYELRVISIAIDTSVKCYSPKFPVPFLQGIPRAVFQQDNACPHVAKTDRHFCSDQHIQLLPWPACLPDMSPINHVWDLVGQGLARDPPPAVSKYELRLCIKAI